MKAQVLEGWGEGARPVPSLSGKPVVGALKGMALPRDSSQRGIGLCTFVLMRWEGCCWSGKGLEQVPL